MDDRLRLRASSLRSFDVRSEKVVAGIGFENPGKPEDKSLETFSLQSDFVPERVLSSRQGAASQAGSGPTVCRLPERWIL